MTLRTRKHLAFIVLAGLVVAGIVFQGIYDWHLRQEERKPLASQPLIAGLIESAVNGIEIPAPVDAKTGDIYFPDVHLTLPAPDQNLSLMRIEYNNGGATDSSSLGLQVTSANIINGAESQMMSVQSTARSKDESIAAIFAQVPNLQACARGVQLFYQAQNNGAGYSLRFTKPIDNGKTIYAYTEKACASPALPALVNYLKQIQSY